MDATNSPTPPLPASPTPTATKYLSWLAEGLDTTLAELRADREDLCQIASLAAQRDRLSHAGDAAAAARFEDALAGEILALPAAEQLVVTEAVS